MTPDQVQIVRATFARILPVKAQAAAVFYRRLFQVAPSMRTMFKSDAKAQGAKLMAALSMVVMDLDRLEKMIPRIQDLARRHVDYGVIEPHYATFGQTLMWTLEKALGPAFTPAVRDAWSEAYGILAEAMIAAAKQVPDRIVAAA